MWILDKFQDQKENRRIVNTYSKRRKSAVKATRALTADYDFESDPNLKHKPSILKTFGLKRRD